MVLISSFLRISAILALVMMTLPHRGRITARKHGRVVRQSHPLNLLRPDRVRFWLDFGLSWRCFPDKVHMLLVFLPLAFITGFTGSFSRITSFDCLRIKLEANSPFHQEEVSLSVQSNPLQVEGQWASNVLSRNHHSFYRVFRRTGEGPAARPSR